MEERNGTEMKRQFPLIRGSSIIIFCISMMAIVGHLQGKPTLYAWGSTNVGMGMPTAVCFLVTSWSLFTLGLDRGHAADRAK